MRYQPKKRMNFREPAAVLAFPALLIGFLLLFIAPAAAEPDLSAKQAEVDHIKAEVSSINLAAEQAVERYNQANRSWKKPGARLLKTKRLSPMLQPNWRKRRCASTGALRVSIGRAP